MTMHITAIIETAKAIGFLKDPERMAIAEKLQGNNR